MISDSERIHTQTIAWILSLNDSIFTNGNKAKFLAKLFTIDQKISISKELYIETELNKIDLFIQTDDIQFIIENKLKSSEHNSQTFSYIDSVPQKLVDSNKKKRHGFLTLIKDQPENENWIPISFGKLETCLKEIDWNNGKKESVFVKEYIETLTNLVSVFNQFVDNHKKFPNVFTDGFKKKFEKEKFTDDSKDYIRTNQLETIFQKAFMKIIAEKLEIDNYELNETRGTALIQTYFDELEIFDNTFRIGFQFQGKSLKINLAHKNYADSKPEQIGEKLTEIFKGLYFNVNGYNKFNKPRSKAYISVSKKIENEIYETCISDLIEMLNKEITFIKSKLEEFRNQINTAYNV
jgi:predicted HicB family RNase H-like nuclease